MIRTKGKVYEIGYTYRYNEYTDYEIEQIVRKKLREDFPNAMNPTINVERWVRGWRVECFWEEEE